MQPMSRFIYVFFSLCANISVRNFVHYRIFECASNAIDIRICVKLEEKTRRRPIEKQRTPILAGNKQWRMCSEPSAMPVSPQNSEYSRRLIE